MVEPAFDDMRDKRLTDVVDGVREGGAGGRSLKAVGSIESDERIVSKLGSAFSWPWFVPARRGGGNGGGLDDAVDTELLGDGCVYCDNSSEIDVDRMDSFVDDLDRP